MPAVEGYGERQQRGLNRRITENSAQKVARYYVPPIAIVDERIDFDRSMDVTVLEEIANLGNIQPVAKVFYEINCSESMLQELSISFRSNGKNGSRNKPGGWKYIPPESNGARL